MAVNRENIMEWAERYINRELNATMLVKINDEINKDDALRYEWNKAILLIKDLHLLEERKRVKALSSEIASNYQDNAQPTFKDNIFNIWTKYKKMTGVAASIALIASMSTYFFATHTSKQTSKSQYIALSREIQNIKHKQAVIDKNIKDEHPAPIVYHGNEAGTGFFISNNGFVATNNHVVSAADSIFVQDSKGNYYRAELIASDEANDIAVLQIRDDKFNKSNLNIPFKLEKTDAPLAQQIFSIGFPKESALYAEGYISSQDINGEDRYQLNMPAYPGHSGSPVFDRHGNVIGMIMGKETYTTFAAKSASLLSLIKKLNNDDLQLTTVNKLKELSRTEQVNKALNYICAVTVYK